MGERSCMLDFLSPEQYTIILIRIIWIFLILQRNYACD